MDDLDEILDHLTERVCRYRIDDLAITFCNRSWAEPFGRTPSELVGMTLDELLPDDALADLRAQLPRLEAAEEVRSQETPRTVDGRVRWEQWVDRLVVGPDGTREVLAVARDITERVDARAAQRTMEEGLRATLDAINAGVMVSDAVDDTVVYVNAVFADLLGVPPEEVARFDAMRHVPRGRRERVRDRRAAIARGERLAPIEFDVAVDGRVRRVEFSERLVPFGGRDAILVTARDVTEIRAGEARAYALVDNLPSAVIARTEEDAVAYANNAAAELLGAPDAEDLVGRSLHDLVEPGNTSRRTAATSMELRCTRSDGSVRLIESRAVDVRIAGEVTTLEVMRDITTEREAIEALAGSERALASVFDAVRDGVIAIDPDGVVVTANRAAANLLGTHDVEMLVGALLSDVLRSCAADDAARDLAASLRTRVLRAGETIDRQLVVLAVAGDQRSFEVGVVPIAEFGAEQPVGAVATLRDVTATERLRTELEQSRSRFRLLAEDAPIGIVTIGASGVPTYCNPMQLRLMGVTETPDEDGWAQLLHPDDHEMAFASWRQVLETRQSDRVEYRYVWPSGEVRHVQVYLVPLADGEVLITQVDVTERHALEERLAHEATHDPLTGLPNRALLMDRLEHALGAAHRDGRWPTVLFCDLDRFKAVNDSFGHAAGDELLCRVADGLTATVRGSDTVARLGGDEFVVLCSSAPDADEVDHVVARIMTLVRRPFVLAGGERASIGVSIGIATGDEDTNTATLLRRADLAVYEAKHAGRGVAVRFDRSRHDGFAAHRGPA